MRVITRFLINSPKMPDDQGVAPDLIAIKLCYCQTTRDLMLSALPILRGWGFMRAYQQEINVKLMSENGEIQGSILICGKEISGHRLVRYSEKEFKSFIVSEQAVSQLSMKVMALLSEKFNSVISRSEKEHAYLTSELLEMHVEKC